VDVRQILNLQGISPQATSDARAELSAWSYVSCTSSQSWLLCVDNEQY
jgi:hypothetical protein